MEPLQFKLFGHPEVRFRDVLLKFRSRKVLALLIYLFVEGGIHRRERLTGLLWPESDEKRARASLRNSLLRLRKSLHPAGERLLVDPETAAFDFSLPHSHDIDTLSEREFLEGFSLPDAPAFEDWLRQQRAHHQRRTEALFDARSRQALETRRFGEAARIAETWTAREPLSETAARRLMQAHHLSGDRSAALRTYARLKKSLSQELGVPPAPETAALAESIRRETAPAAEPRTPARLPVLPFVGRATEHGRLAASFRRALSGETRAVCVEGEAGIGKTRLVETFMDWAALQGPLDILRGRAFEIGGQLPYQPLVDALRERLDLENAPEDLLADVWLAELSQLLPELRDRYPDLPPASGGSPDYARSRLFEAVSAFGQALARRRPLILFIDDVQWADPGSWDMLQYLAHRWAAGRERILLVWTVRVEALAASSELGEWLGRLGRDIPLERLELPPLQEEEVRQLVAFLSDENEQSKNDTGRFSGWLQGETGGQPFFVTEMLKMLEERGILVGGNFGAALEALESTGQVPVPPNVRELILARLRRIPDEAEGLLLAAAVVGREADFERLRTLAGLDELAGLRALEALVSSRLLIETGLGARPYRFAHDNIRAVVYSQAGEARRRIFHRRAFENLPAAAPAAEYAFHAAAAWLPQEAFRYALAAGMQAAAGYAFTEAALYFRQAADLLGRVETDPDQRRRLCEQFGRALELDGRYAEALDHYHAMLALARNMADRELELAALAAIGTVYTTANDQNDIARGEALTLEALELARELGDEPTEARLQWNLLNVYRFTQRTDLAQAAGERSLELARAHGLDEQLAYTSNDLGYVHQALGELETMLELLEVAIPIWRRTGNLPMLTDSLASRASNTAYLGDPDRALAFADEALAISRSLDNPWSQSFTLFAPCFVHWYRMETTEALAAMRECVALAEGVGFVGGMVLMSAYQAQLLLEFGQVDQARSVMEGRLALAERALPLFASGAAGTEVLIALARDDLAAAENLLGRFPISGPPYDFMNSFTLEQAACEYWLQIGEPGRALDLAGHVAKFVEGKKIQLLLPPQLLLVGRALAALGDRDQACEALQRGVEISQRTGARYKRWQTHALLAEIAEQGGNAAEAAAQRVEARGVLEEILARCEDAGLAAWLEGHPHVRRLLARDSNGS